MAASGDLPRISEIRNRLSKIYNGVINVPTVYCNIDILCNNRIIIVKELNEWEKGLGILYIIESIFTRNKHLHLYNVQSANQELLNKIITVLNSLNITLTFEQ